MFKKLMKNKLDKKLALAVMKDFVEGRITTEDFWLDYKDSIAMQKILINDKTRPLGVHNNNSTKGEFEYNKNTPYDSMSFVPEKLLEVIDIKKLEHKFELYKIIRDYFWRNNQNYNFFNIDADKYIFLLEILPDYLHIIDEALLNKIINSAPEGISEEDKIIFCKEIINKLFRYDNIPPEWIQSSEWPIINDKPLVFSRQETDFYNVDHELFYFYDDETKRVTIVDQYY